MTVYENIYAFFAGRFPSDRRAPFIETPAGGHYSYGDLERESARYARFLTGLGLQPGDRVAVQIEKSPAAVFLYLGCLRAGLIYLPLNPAYRATEIEYYLDDADFVIVGFGTAGRVSLSAVRAARQKGIKVGLLRPISVSPFPFAVIDQLASRVSAFLVVEMNTGQMLNDVQLAVKGRVPVEFYGRLGGVVPFPNEIYDEITRMATTKLSLTVDPRAAWVERMTAEKLR